MRTTKKLGRKRGIMKRTGGRDTIEQKIDVATRGYTQDRRQSEAPSRREGLNSEATGDKER